MNKLPKIVYLLFAFVVVVLVAEGIYYWRLKTLEKKVPPREEAISLSPTPAVIGGGPHSKVPRPKELKTEVLEDAIVIKWLRPDSQNIFSYRVYRTKLEGMLNWGVLTEIKIEDPEKEWYEYRDSSVKPGIIYAYGVVAVNSKGEESALAQSHSLNLKRE